jgi:uncharacterized protein (DUF305 family)
VRQVQTAALILGGILLAAACSSSDDDAAAPRVVQPGRPGETSRVLTDDEVAALEVPGHSATDVAFMQGMISHHGQAVRMTSLVEGRTARDDLPKMAERIEVSQRDEIAQMEAWLTARGETVPDAGAHDHGGGLMPGMLTEDEFAALEAASGPEFDRLFLLFMIRHHQGALQMVSDLLASDDGGLEPEVFQLAQHIDADQRIEIARLNDVLELVEA